MSKGVKVKGGAIVLTIVISLILAILCSMMALIFIYNLRIQQKNSDLQRIRNNSESAINLILGDTNPIGSVSGTNIDLFGDGDDSVIIKSGSWGVFQFANIKAGKDGHINQKSFLYGALLPDYMNGCLYLADHKRPLVIAGGTSLEGDVYLPKDGLTINANGDSDSSGVPDLKGLVKLSEKRLPDLDSLKVTSLFDHLKFPKPFITFSPNTILNDQITQSFGDSCVQISAQGPLLLNRCSINGHIIVYSDTLIEITAQADLNNILLVAPNIIFRKGFHGTIQALASNKIIVENDCFFSYPSSLVLMKWASSPEQSTLTIGESSTFTGVIISFAYENDFSKTLVEIGKNTNIEGTIYCKGYLGVKGKVIGSVLTDYFIYRSPASVFENYLVGVGLNRHKLSDYFLGSQVFRDAKTQNIIEWLQ